MIESSAHGEDYDGVIFSQLVCEHYLEFFRQHAHKHIACYSYFCTCILRLELD